MTNLGDDTPVTFHHFGTIGNTDSELVTIMGDRIKRCRAQVRDGVTRPLKARMRVAGLISIIVVLFIGHVNHVIGVLV